MKASKILNVWRLREISNDHMYLIYTTEKSKDAKSYHLLKFNASNNRMMTKTPLIGLVFLPLFEAKKKTESLEHKIHFQYINWFTREVNHVFKVKAYS